MSILNAAYMYYMADAGFEDIPFVTQLTLDRGMRVIQEKAGNASESLFAAKDGTELGRLLAEGIRTIEYYGSLQKQALLSIERIGSLPHRLPVAGHA